MAAALAVTGEPSPPPRGACAPGSLSPAQLARVVLPPGTYPSASQLAPHGMYLLEHSAALALVIGGECDEELVKDTLGEAAPPAAQLPPGLTLPALNTEFSLRLWTIIAALRARRPQYLPVLVLAPADVDRYAAAARLFTEDKAADAPSYVDLLCDLHSAIQKKLSAPQ